MPVWQYIRLHVVAADDSDRAQALKLEVRDACLAAARGLLADCEDPEEAWRRVGRNLEALRLAAARRAGALGYAGTVTAQAGVFEFPERRYGARMVPAGTYRALRVVLGPGAGRNWWCVLYPSLCVPEGTPPGFYWALPEWLRGLLGGGR